MHPKAKSLKRNDGEHSEIPIAPSKLPRHFSVLGFPPLVVFSTHCPQWHVGFGPKSRGADGKPTKPFLNYLQQLSQAIGIEYGSLPRFIVRLITAAPSVANSIARRARLHIVAGGGLDACTSASPAPPALATHIRLTMHLQTSI
jgi:hypothetical protein